MRLLRSLSGVSAGTLVLALCSYVTLVLAARALGPDGYGDFAVVWALVFVVGPGLFLPVEQEGSRSTAAALATGGAVGARPVVRATVVVLLPLLLLLVLLRAPLGDALGVGPGLVVALAVSLAGVAASHAVRGLLAGAGRLAEYGRGLAAEGALRLVAATGLAASGGRSPALWVALAGVPAGLGALAGRRRTGDSPREAPDESLVPDRAPGAAGVAWLVTGSLCAQLLINAGPVAGALIAGPATAGPLLAGLVLARVPLLGFATLQTVLLPHLSRLAARSLSSLALLRRVAAGCLLAGVVAVAASAAVGPPVQRLLFGADLALPRTDLCLLVAAVMAFGTASLLGAGLVVAHRGQALASCWLSGAAVFAAGLLVLPERTAGVAAALLGGCLTAAVLVACQVLPRPKER